MINTDNDDDDDLKENIFNKLQEVSINAFPKICNNCGKIYHSIDDFTDQRGLSELSSRNNAGERIKVVTAFSNCQCGTTLALKCYDRRDTSLEGLKRRQIFNELVNDLCNISTLDYLEAQLLIRKLFKQLLYEGKTFNEVINNINDKHLLSINLNKKIRGIL